jgi:glutathione peroxidase
MSNPIYDIGINRIDGSDATLKEHEGDVLLVVNVASRCGLTPQYEGLEKIHENYRDKGFAVLGFPANNFAGQEPGSNDEIKQFCETQFGVQFPLYSKISVKGDDRHPLYDALIGAHPDRVENEPSQLKKVLEENNLAPDNDLDVMWNFEKFLVGRDGTVIERFAPDVTPDDERLTGAIEKALG